MSHTIRNKTRLLNRVKRISGQVAAIEKALKTETECGDVLQLIASVRGAVNGLMAEILEDHIRSHVTDTDGHPAEEREQGAKELVELVRTYLK